jgi:hypothetical protein
VDINQNSAGFQSLRQRFIATVSLVQLDLTKSKEAIGSGEVELPISERSRVIAKRYS